MKYILVFAVLVRVAATLLAQNHPVPLTEEELRRFTSHSGYILMQKPDALYEGVRGTPYYSESWSTGNVYFKDSMYILNLNLRYDVYTDEVEYKHSKTGTVMLIQKEQIKSFELMGENGEKLLFGKFLLNPKLPEIWSYAQILYDGKTKLLAKYTRQFVPADYQGAYSQNRRYDEYRNGILYYIVLSDGTVEKTRLESKPLLKLLRDKEKELNEYIISHNLNLEHITQVIGLLEYFDTLH